jgi:hypothetical protein
MADDLNNADYIGDARVFHDSSGDASWIGDQRVYRDSSGQATWVGDQRVYRDSSGDITWIGDERVYHDSSGDLSYVGDDRVYSSSSGGGYSGAGGGGDLLTAILAFGLVLLAFAAIAGLLALILKTFAAVFNGWRGLCRRYPRAMTVVHLLLMIGLVFGGLRYLEFPLEIQIAGSALVPLLWGWLWLTRRLPMVFMPINAALFGGGLYLAAHATAGIWQPVWSGLSAGLPLVGDLFVSNLPMMLAVLPMTLWLWGLGARRWSAVFEPPGLVVLGALCAFVLMRVWTGWQPLWAAWTAPLPQLTAAVVWLILAVPLVRWLWVRGAARCPLPFTALGLLIFGGALALTAQDTRPEWMPTWQHWARGLPFAAFPLATIGIAPCGLWGWNVASRRWQRALVIPNLLLTGGVLWLVADRTRSLWSDAWGTLWGPLPALPALLDPAIILLALPITIWLWKRGSRQWPRYWGAIRALLAGGILWCLVARTADVWRPMWSASAGPHAPDLALVALALPLTLWGWSRLSLRWPRVMGTLAWPILAALAIYLCSLFLPNASRTFRATVGFAILMTGGWFWLMRRKPGLGCLAALVPWLALGLIIWQWSPLALQLWQTVETWLVQEGVLLGA